jgi:hypothetical protein
MTALLPIGIDFVTWASELCNTFSTQNIPEVSSEKDWKHFADMLRLNRCFEDKYFPGTEGFSDWRQWASEFNLSLGV